MLSGTTVGEERRTSKTDIFYDKDADLGRLEGRGVAVIGYSNQGRSQALNMRDSGVENVQVGSVRDENWKQAEVDGFKPMPIDEAVEVADISLMLLPDEIAPEVYREHVEPFLGPGKTLDFTIGYNIAFGHIVVPEGVDVIMVAPRMIGEALRSIFLDGKGAPCSVDAHTDASGYAWEGLPSPGKAVGWASSTTSAGASATS